VFDQPTQPGFLPPEGTFPSADAAGAHLPFSLGEILLLFLVLMRHLLLLLMTMLLLLLLMVLLTVLLLLLMSNLSLLL